MGMRFTNLIGVLVLAAASSVIAESAIAQRTTISPVGVPVSPFTLGIPDVVERAFFEDSQTFFENNSTRRQFNLIFGVGGIDRASYPDLEIVRDAQRITILYRELLEQQVSSDPVIRTPDLPNPFNTSILQSPTVNVNVSGTRVTGSEFVFERQPFR